jgi:hypothetical protein
MNSLRGRGSDATLSFAVEYFLQHYRPPENEKSVADAATEYLEKRDRDCLKGFVSSLQLKAIRHEMEWPKKQGKIRTPAVVGAILNLGNCFDLLDTRYTEALQRAWPMFKEARKANREKLPSNRDIKHDTAKDKLLRYRDCAVINWTISEFEKSNVAFDAVRSRTQAHRGFRGHLIKSKIRDL